MGLKRMVKRIIELSREKEVVAVPRVVDNDKLLDGKVAVILGGTGGLGKAITKSLLESGCKVVLCGTNEEKLRKAAAIGGGTTNVSNHCNLMLLISVV